MASNFPPKKNVAFTWYFFMKKTDGTIILNPGTLASAVHVDGNVTEITNSTLAVVDTGTGLCSIVLAQTTMNGDQIDGRITCADAGMVAYTFKLLTTANTQDEIVAGTVKSKVDVDTIKTQTVTCAAAVTVLASVGAPAAPGAATGLTTVAAGGVKQQQTVDLTAGQSIACSDKTGFSLSATGADLILKTATFVVAIRDAINEFATYGLTALNTLLVTTGIKAATIPAATLVANQHVIVDSGTVTTLSNLPAVTNDWLTGAGVKADAVTKIQTGLATPTNITAGTITTVTNLTNAPTVGDLTAAMKLSVNAEADTAISDAGIPAATKTAIEVAGSHLTLILEDTGTTIPGTITTMQGNVTTIMADTDLLDDVAGGLADIHTDVGTAITQATEANAHAHAIDLQTAKLVFTVANELDANIQSVNDTALTGNGSALTPWGPV